MSNIEGKVGSRSVDGQDGHPGGLAAQVSQLALATRNVRDFEGCGLALVNPFETV